VDAVDGRASDGERAGAIRLVEEAGEPVLRLVGDIDGSVVSAYQLRATDGGAPVATRVVDASAVTYLDCRALRFLAQQAGADDHRPVLLLRPTRVVRRLVDLTGSAARFAIA
jgi:anti-anti-sigma factor